MPAPKDGPRINEEIRVREVQLIDQTGHNHGPTDIQKAIAMAQEAGLDLVEIAPNSVPPVCKILDFGKYKYQQRKKHHNGKVHHTKIKEIRLRPKTGDHDIGFKVKQAKTFLQGRDKVQVSVVFRGREIVHVEEGKRVIDEVIQQLEEVGKVETAPMQQGRRIVCTIAPR